MILSNYPAIRRVACMHFLHTLVITASIFGAASSAQQSSFAPAGTTDDTRPLTLALEYENDDSQPERETASLQVQVPAANPGYREDRRCMTVCSRWGEDCVTLNPGADPVTRKCVRTCKSFAEECL